MIDAIRKLILDPSTKQRIEALTEQADARLAWLEAKSKAVGAIVDGMASGTDVSFEQIQALAFLPEGATPYVFAPGTRVERVPLSAGEVKLEVGMDEGSAFPFNFHSNATERVEAITGAVTIIERRGVDDTVIRVFPGRSHVIDRGVLHAIVAEENLTFVSTFTLTDETN